MRFHISSTAVGIPTPAPGCHRNQVRSFVSISAPKCNLELSRLHAVPVSCTRLSTTKPVPCNPTEHCKQRHCVQQLISPAITTSSPHHTRSKSVRQAQCAILSSDIHCRAISHLAASLSPQWCMIRMQWKALLTTSDHQSQPYCAGMVHSLWAGHKVHWEHHHQAAQQTHNRCLLAVPQGAAVPSALIQAITVSFLHLAYSSRASTYTSDLAP
jgi:hypothetical protein